MDYLDDFLCEQQSDEFIPEEDVEFEPGHVYWDEMAANP